MSLCLTLTSEKPSKCETGASPSYSSYHLPSGCKVMNDFFCGKEYMVGSPNFIVEFR